MALYATNRFAGDGRTTQFEINFVGQYIDRSHVKVYQEDNLTKVRTYVPINDSNFLNDTTLRNLPVTPVGSTLVIYRDTPKPPLVDFVNGSRFTEYNMDLVARQGLFVAMEAMDAGGSDARQQLLDAIAVVVGLAGDATAAASNATQAALEAALRAADAADSANQAGAARVAAVAARDAAQASAGNAATSATNASNSASAAASSASAANTSATNAATSATNAGNSATAAANSASTASTKATEASNAASAAASSASAASASAAAASVDAAMVQASLMKFVSVKDFGAVGDGGADDTNAFNSCPSGLVYIPDGVYRLAGWVPKGGTRYVFAGGAVLTQHSGSSPIVALPDGIKAVTFSGGTFTGIPSSVAGGFVLADKRGSAFRNDILFEGCTFDNFGGMAMALGGAKGCRIVRCTFRRTAQANIPSGTTSWPAIWLSDDQNLAGYDQASDILIDGCTFGGLSWSGVYALGTRIAIRGSQFRNTRESAIFISHFATRVSVTGCVIDTATMQNISASGVEVGGEFIDVSGNRITNCGAYGVSVQDAFFFNVTGNLLSFNKVGVGVISSSADHAPRYGAIKANTVTNSSDRGLFAFKVGPGGSITDCDFSGNQVSTSGYRDIDLTPGVLLPQVGINFNSAYTRQPASSTLNVIGHTVGTGRTLLSTWFRPSALQVTAIQGGSVNMSVGTATFDGAGVVQGAQTVSGAGTTAEYKIIYLPGIFEATATAPEFNAASGMWDVKYDVTVNAGVGVWATVLATP